ncbi:putative 2-dehydropantoate 2-reductase family protein [Aulographum hederae CBS 113979]|uniref:Putative 2-dehydropantoate 2-reductase family protein n=1 Tax=Aulographum hederae CBS 113979 TaxID=1176131 RepID=A0A6G1GZA3_9PEZI|nr:putative 2-dehydropantoate 2-reductase family protein [Aulographum hederae CBS 113979]
MISKAEAKKRVLFVGGGGVGSIGALNLELGGLAEVTLALRSNYKTVVEKGYDITSCDHGRVEGWRPTHVLDHIPNILSESLPPYDYIVLATKNIPDIPPTLSSLLFPAVTPSHTAIVLIQNGLNIEKPLLEAFPTNCVLSGISFIGAHETRHGVIEQADVDRLSIGAFRNPNLIREDEEAVAREFVRIYGAGGKTDCVYEADVPYQRWRKLIYNTCLNSICAITGMDTGRIQLQPRLLTTIVRPAMEEVRLAALSCGIALPLDIADTMIAADAIDMYGAPSMLVDIQKGNFIEVENLLGEPLREGRARGVEMGTVGWLYEVCGALQWRERDRRGMVERPERREYASVGR